MTELLNEQDFRTALEDAIKGREAKNASFSQAWASGELTLKGVTRPVAFDFVFEIGDGASVPAASARLRGGMNLDRFDFDIASDLDVNVAGKDVYVEVELGLASP